MDRNQTPSKTAIQLSDSEFAKRAAPGGRLPVKGAADNTYGDKGWTSIAESSPAAVAGEAERQVRRDRPEIVAKRASKGK
jgi:hypothetical protein